MVIRAASGPRRGGPSPDRPPLWKTAGVDADARGVDPATGGPHGSEDHEGLQGRSSPRRTPWSRRFRRPMRRSSSGARRRVLVDLRDPRELEREGKVPGAFHCPRGMLEFWIDPESPYHKPVFAEDKRFVFFCGGRMALGAGRAHGARNGPEARGPHRRRLLGVARGRRGDRGRRAEAEVLSGRAAVGAARRFRHDRAMTITPATGANPAVARPSASLQG